MPAPRSPEAPPRTVHLPVSRFSALHDHTVGAFPAAAAGLLLGDPATLRVEGVQPVRRPGGAAPRAQDLQAARDAARQAGTGVLGHYASRPDGSALPSTPDRLPGDGPHVCLLAAVHGPDGPEGDGAVTRLTELRAWRLSDDGAHALDLVLLPSPARGAR
jgi:proteasome lid subunit RPN8/RPN11